MNAHFVVGFSIAVLATAVGCTKVSLQTAVKDAGKSLEQWDQTTTQSKKCLYVSSIAIESDASRDFQSDISTLIAPPTSMAPKVDEKVELSRASKITITWSNIAAANKDSVIAQAITQDQIKQCFPNIVSGK